MVALAPRPLPLGGVLALGFDGPEFVASADDQTLGLGHRCLKGWQSKEDRPDTLRLGQTLGLNFEDDRIEGPRQIGQDPPATCCGAQDRGLACGHILR